MPLIAEDRLGIQELMARYARGVARGFSGCCPAVLVGALGVLTVQDGYSH